LNLKERQALGMWIEGDGLGELIAVRLQSPQHLSFGAVADRYINVDFTGRRWFTLVETESTRWSDYTWNDGKSLYNVYRETIDVSAIESFEIWCQNLPPGKQVKCGIGPVEALPLLSGIVRDPAITVNGTTIVFPGALTSGSWLECNGPENCIHYGAKGEVIGKVAPSGPLPTLRAAQNLIQFSCTSTNGPSPRVRVTVFTQGAEL